ncbi:MAG: aminopeptidase P family protein [Clostridiales bacterium]|nr:aminopeptidase P family protein [Clostridiales bacterium]
MTVKERIASLRKLMEEHHIDAYIVLDSDEHISEYPPDHYKERRWVSGFTGSAGTVVITADKAGLWTDGRYYLQAGSQLAGSGITLYRASDAGVITMEGFLCRELEEGSTVALNGRVASTAQVLRLREQCGEHGISLRTDRDLIGALWTQDRPEMPREKAVLYPVEYAGLTTAQKLQQVREQMERQHLDCYIIGALDSVDWLMNLRGNDVDTSPLFTAFAVVRPEEAILFASAERITPAVAEELEKNGVRVEEYGSIYTRIADLPGRSRVGLAAASVNAAIYDELGSRVDRVLIPDICQQLKAVKNHVEIQHIRTTHKHDGVAMVRFLMWLEKAIKGSRLTEWTVCEKLLELRGAQPGFKGISFETIAGYGANGAIVHYEPTADSCAELREGSFLLVDSGGQYLGGTTDITRTIPLGSVPSGHRRDYTLVLQAFIHLHSARFLEGSTGKSLDVLARQVMWENGLDYKHGTGHGVGCYLNVHEGPNNFSNAVTALEEGMIISIEPGIYRAGQLGIRTENLVLVTRDRKSDEYGQFYRFEPLTLCPINTAAIELSMLSKEEVRWLNDYHRTVFEQLSPMLEPEEVKWLGAATTPLHV